MADSLTRRAMRLRDVVRRVARNEVERLRPRPRYGTVSTIDRPGLKCTVQFVNEPAPVPVRMGSVQPSATGQTVRVDGPTGDRFITDVLGAAFYA